MNIIVTGSIAYDYLMRFPGRFADHFIEEQMHQVSLSFLVDDMSKHDGGVAANIAYTMALLNLHPKLMGTAGRDFGDYRQRLEAVGVDTSTVIQLDDVFTASFFVNTDLDNNQIASFYAGAMGHAKNYTLADVGVTEADLVIISPNAPEAMIQLADECRQRGLRFVYDPSQQVPRLSGEELAAGMDGAYAMVVNGYEAEIITKKTGKTLDDLRRDIDIVVVTHGGDGSTVYENGSVHDIPAFPPRVIKDPTGGGDAYRAGLLRGIASGWPLPLAAKVGALCATFVLENTGTQNHRFDAAAFIARFREHADDEGLLDSLLVAETSR